MAEQDTFGDFGSLGQLLQIIKHHMDFMNKQEAHVDEFISKRNSPALLRAAKQKALDNEKELMNQIKNITVLTEFLNNIILIENLFNSFYTPQQRQQQQTARKTYAPNIQYYESKPKPISDVQSFVDLMFAGTNVYLPTFKKWLQKVETQCTQQGIKMVSNSGAKCKNIERAFYKSFYVYAVKHGDQAFKQMTDVLRCSLVFDNFDAMYQCFGVIEQLAKADASIADGILRVKDRYNHATMPFGYRDMLINIYCPGSKVVCEIQLHHLLFYKCKKISHNMYKKARLFEDVETDENLAYKFADTEIRSQVGDKVYQLQNDDMDEEDDADAVFEKHELEMTLTQVFENYKGGLSKFVSNFHGDGYGEEDEQIHKFMEDLPLYDEIEEFEPSNKKSWEELAGYGMKMGHVKKYKKMLTELKSKKHEFEKILAKRERVTKKRAAIATEDAKQEDQEDASEDDDGGLSDWLISIGFRKKELAQMLAALSELGLDTMDDLESILIDLYKNSYGDKNSWIDKIQQEIMSQKGITFAQWMTFSVKAQAMIEYKVKQRGPIQKSIMTL